MRSETATSIKIDFIRYKSFYQIQVLIEFFVRRSERTLRTRNVFRQKSGVLFNLKERADLKQTHKTEAGKKNMQTNLTTSSANFLTPLPLKKNTPAAIDSFISLCRLNF